MSEYSGGLNNGVFAYLDALQPEPKKYKRSQLEYKNDMERECCAKLLKGIKDILHDSNLKRGEYARAIRKLQATLREEYPQFANSLK